MQLESHATPTQETPQQRYATLHRAIERGLDSDEVWRELAEVSLQLGHTDEAVNCLRRIRGAVVQQLVRSRLVRAGAMQERTGPAAADHAAAPAASDAGGRRHQPTRNNSTRLQDHVVDAVQYLLHQHMPLLVLMTTLAFPVVVGMGGFLTAGGSPFLLAAIAALPGLMVLAVVGAMGREILVTSSQGIGDVPNVPEFGALVADARRFLADAVLVLGSLLLPSLGAMALGAPAASTLPGLAIGAFFTPMAWALRQVRGDYGALSPTTLLRAVTRAGVSYVGLVLVCWLLFTPAATVAWIVCSRPVWVQIAMVGPLGVLPLFLSSRLLGTWLDAKRTDLASVLTCPPKAATNQAATPVSAPRKKAVAKTNAPVQPRPTAAAPQPRLPKRPAHLEHFTPPNLKRAQAPAQAAPRPAAPRPPAAAPAPSRQRPATTAPATKPAATPAAPNKPRAALPKAPAAAPKAAEAAPKAPAPKTPVPAPKPAEKPAPAKPEPRAIEGRVPRRSLNDQPDLTHLPGAVVVKGRERQQHGAAATRPQ